MSKHKNQAVDFRYVNAADWQRFLEKGGTLSDALDLQPREIECFYALAFEKYTNGQYAEALPLFQCLVQSNHLEARFALGLGLVRQGLKQFELAAQTHSFAGEIHLGDPRFPFSAAECYLAQGNLEAAQRAFVAAALRSYQKPAYAALHKQARQHLENLQVHLNKMVEQPNHDNR